MFVQEEGGLSCFRLGSNVVVGTDTPRLWCAIQYCTYGLLSYMDTMCKGLSPRVHKSVTLLTRPPPLPVLRYLRYCGPSDVREDSFLAAAGPQKPLQPCPCLTHHRDGEREIIKMGKNPVEILLCITAAVA